MAAPQGPSSRPQAEKEMREFIVSAPISEPRVQEFRLDYLKGRTESGALETAFTQAGKIRHEDEWKEDLAFGFGVIVQKGPFVDGSNWIGYQGWQFALATERFLLSRFESSIRDSNGTVKQRDETRNWERIIESVDDLTTSLNAPKGAQRLILITGGLHENWLLDLTRQEDLKPDWELPTDLNKTWVLGTYQDSLILRIDESPASSVHVLSMDGFNELAQFGRAQLSVEAISTDLADEISSRAENPISPYDLQEKVLLRLYESWEVGTPKDPSAVGSVDFAV